MKDKLLSALNVALVVLEQQEAKVAALLRAIKESEQTGPFAPLDLEAFLASRRKGEPVP